jgi:YVTN family beta-propeller protein
VYVGLENADELVAIDTATHMAIATIPIGQAPQAVVYVPDAGLDGSSTTNLQPLGVAGRTTHLTLVPPGPARSGVGPTSVSLFDQGLTQVLQASVTGLEPKRSYVLALSDTSDGKGPLKPLAAFTTNPAGSAIVNALGPIRQVVQGEGRVQRRYLVIVPDTDGRQHGPPVQVQVQK